MRASVLIIAVGAASTAAFVSPGSSAQQVVPIIDLPAAAQKTTSTIGSVLGIREVSGGRIIVNDAGRRQLLMFDTTLSSARVLFDSIEGMANSYGPRGVPLIPYLGDSSLMSDATAGPGPLLVINGRGQLTRTLALPNAKDGSTFLINTTWADALGRLYYPLGNYITMPGAGTVGAQEKFADSTPVVRADLDSRVIDTVGRIGKNKGEYTRIDHTDAKKIIRTVMINPLPTPDEWAVTTDGSVAFVRGHDYHIDWVRPDGSKFSTAKLPFDWKRLTDEDKQKLTDSAYAAHKDQNALAARERNTIPPPPPPTNDSPNGTPRQTGGAGVSRAAYDAGGLLWVPLNYEVVAAKDIPDYYPAIRKGAVTADRDNHLWILPTTSAQSRKGELIYDVVNTKGELFERVRMPVGRLIAGFGKGGVVYMLAGDKKNGFILERTRLPAH